MRRMLRPAKDRMVRHVDTRAPLAAEGEEVEMSKYWRRRLADGDVEIVQPSKAKAKAKTTAAEEAD